MKYKFIFLLFTIFLISCNGGSYKETDNGYYGLYGYFQTIDLHDYIILDREMRIYLHVKNVYMKEIVLLI